MQDFTASPITPISLRGFYDRQPTKLLQAIRAGFERDFDQVSSGEAGYPPADWLSHRLRVINELLEQRTCLAQDRPVFGPFYPSAFPNKRR